MEAVSYSPSRKKAVALFSGGLDSMLAVRIVQEQGFEVEALNIRTTFDRREAPAAIDLGVRVTVLSVGDDYLGLIRNPSHGYGRGLNPCVDCRAYMVRMAKRMMEEIGACVVITGEILGQRPNSQQRPHLDVVAGKAGLKGRLLRPLSAKLLPPTIPEQEGLIDRRGLYDFNGRSRKGLIELAEKLGIRRIPQPSTGCALTETTFVPRVRDLFEFQPDAGRWDFELLNTGRHIRLNKQTKIVVGRDERENAVLGEFFARQDAPQVVMAVPENFIGPAGLMIGQAGQDAIELLASLLLRYTRRFDPHDARVRVADRSTSRVMRARPTDEAWSVRTL